MDGPQSESLGSNGAHGDSSSPENSKYDPKYAEFFQAVRTGNLEATREFLKKHPGAVRERISTGGKLPLHIAALFGHLEIVKELLQRMSAEDAAVTDSYKITALNEATYSRIDVAECLIAKNSSLLTIAKENGLIPVTRAFGIGQIQLARYLYSVTPKEVLTPEYGNHGATLLTMCYYRDLLDIALDLLDNCPSLAVTPDNHGVTFLETLASIPSKFPSGCQFSFWQRWIYDKIVIKKEQLRTFDHKAQHKTIQPNSVNEDVSIDMPETSPSRSDNTSRTKKKTDNNTMVSSGRKSIYQIKLAHERARELLRIACQELSTLDEGQLKTSRARLAIIQAAKTGIPEFITEVLKVHLQLFWNWEGDGNGRNLIHVAVQFRRARVFNLIHGMVWKNSVANMVDSKGNTLLHMAGLLAPSKELHDISGAALQMQRELQWFKEVEGITPPWRKEFLNGEEIKMIPRQLFTENHKELVKDGEKWMKGMANSCTVVAALVATIVFAVAFTIPGGNDQNTGYPIFSKKKGFKVFMISDAVSLISSCTSMLIFLGILTSRYAEDDFLMSLPTKLIIGLSTLFVSMASMLAAFCAALFVMLNGELWIVIPVSILAAIPVLSFSWYQFPLLLEMTMSTYWPSIFDRNVEPWLIADSITQLS